MNLPVRLRRLRQSSAVRRLVCETQVTAADLIQPLFIHDASEDTPIASLPGMVRHTTDSMLVVCRELAELGIPGVAIFPVVAPERKDARGSHGLAEDNLLYHVVRRVKTEVPELAVITDVALDPYTSHGHDGVLTGDGSQVANDETAASRK